MTNSQAVKGFVGVLVLILAVLVFASCAAPVAPAEQERMPAVLKAIPDTGAPSEKVDYFGSNFQPHEKVIVCILMARGPAEFPAECIISGKNIAMGTAMEKAMLQVNEVGSFHIEKIKLPKEEGVWPVRVYSEDGEMLASTLVVVKTPEEK